MTQKEQLERALQIVRTKGPVLPVHIVKELGGNTMTAGAILSTLAVSKQVMISNAKYGGSPLYYVKGQEQKLVMLYDKLQDKEKEAYNLLKSKSVLRDREQEPGIRVALRQIKDFSIPLNVSIKGEVEIFWKWYLLSDENASGIIKKILGDYKQEKVEEKIQQKQVVEQKINVAQPKITLEQPIRQKIEQKPKQELYNVQSLKLFDKELEKREQESKRLEKPKKIKIELEPKILDYINRNSINKTNTEVVRKNKEINMIVEIPSKIGSLTFFLKAKDKKTINDSDIILAYNEAQQKKLPVLYLSTGTLTKKAGEYIDKNLKGQLIFRSLV